MNKTFEELGFKAGDTVQECIVDTRETINGVEDSSGIVFYALCDPDSKAV